MFNDLMFMRYWLEYRIRSFFEEEDGIGTVEMILILIVLIALVIIFRDQLKTIVGDLFDKVTTQSNSV